MQHVLGEHVNKGGRVASASLGMPLKKDGEKIDINESVKRISIQSAGCSILLLSTASSTLRYACDPLFKGTPTVSLVMIVFGPFFSIRSFGLAQ